MRKSLVAILAITGGCTSNLRSSSYYDANGIDSKTLKAEEIAKVQIEDWQKIVSDSYDTDEVSIVESFKGKPYEELLKANLTIREVGIYCSRILESKDGEYDNRKYGKDFWQSGKLTHVLGEGDCDDGACAAACLLYSQGFTPAIVFMYGGEEGHAVFLYRDQTGKYGSIGINSTDIRPAEFSTVGELVSVVGKALDENYTRYKIYNLAWNNRDFINSAKNIKPGQN